MDSGGVGFSRVLATVRLIELEIETLARPVFLVCASQNRFKGGDDARVKLALDSLSETQPGYLAGHCVAVRPV